MTGAVWLGEEGGEGGEEVGVGEALGHADR